MKTRELIKISWDKNAWTKTEEFGDPNLTKYTHTNGIYFWEGCYPLLDHDLEEPAFAGTSFSGFILWVTWLEFILRVRITRSANKRFRK